MSLMKKKVTDKKQHRCVKMLQTRKDMNGKNLIDDKNVIDKKRYE
jgi:hypothetical protein